MFSRKFSIRKRKDFLRTKNLGQCIKLRDVIVQYLVHNGTSGCCRFGYTVTKKLGNAVCRNRIKRRLRHSAYSVFKNDSVLGNSIDIVFIARFSIKDCSWPRLIQQVTDALLKIKTAL